jgi:Ca2+-binding EF-hand superfamily protein
LKGKIMSAISGVSGQSNAWTNAATQRSQMQAKMFSKVDADSSGGVDQTELQTLFTDISKKTGTSLDASKLFTSMDTDANGSLSSQELASGMQSVMPPPSTMDFAQSRNTTAATDDLFSKVDANSDGSVDETEMTAFTDKMKTETGRDSPTSFAQLDSNSDGKLTQTEFDAGKPGASTHGAAATSATQGAGSTPPAGGPGGPGGATGATSASSSDTTYDPLDTNQDGTVSEMERLAGALKDLISTSESGSGSATVDDNILKLAQLVYEQVANNNSTTASTSTLDATA